MVRAEDLAKIGKLFVLFTGHKFDSHLWFQALMEAEMPPKIVLRGQGLLSLKMRQNGVEARDSLLFLPGVPLSKFASTFGLEEGKGHFPLRLNSAEWIDFDNPKPYSAEGLRFPPLEAFYTETLRPKAKQELETWHNETAAKYVNDPSLVYCPTTELIRYCTQDVTTLRKGF